MVYEEIHTRLEQIKKQMDSALARSGRDAEKINLVAASKGQSAEKLQNLYRLGVFKFGENYLQEALLKQDQLKHLSIEWHYLGKIQRKKWRKILEKFSVIHSFDRFDLIQPEVFVGLDRPRGLFVEVNLANESSKGGVSKDAAFEMVQLLLPLKNLKLLGLMVMPPLNLSDAELRNYFKEAFQLRERIYKALFYGSARDSEFQHLSMGTSHDYVQAIEEGATFVRLGSCLLGPREI